MPVQLTITGEDHAAFLAEARGVLAGFGGPVAYVHREPPIETQTFGPSTDAPSVEQGSQTPAVAEEAPKTGRGRPRKDTTAANTPAAEPTPPAPVFVVRRYGGTKEGEFADSGAAATALLDLMREAADPQALAELMKANEAELAMYPPERAAQIAEAHGDMAAALEKASAAGAIEKPPAADAPARVHYGVDNQPLTELTPDLKGAMNGTQAVVAMDGGAQGDHFTKAKAFLESIGAPRVSQIPEGDPKVLKVVEWMAAYLGLPVAGKTGALV